MGKRSEATKQRLRWGGDHRHYRQRVHLPPSLAIQWQYIYIYTCVFLYLFSYYFLSINNNYISIRNPLSDYRSHCWTISWKSQRSVSRNSVSLAATRPNPSSIFVACALSRLFEQGRRTRRGGSSPRERKALSLSPFIAFICFCSFL